ncbi:MAG: hypothetical protein EZS28_005916 [Streblomastix strix]|uniref:Uncharacterized protein n=1 Tax=Streblomastix strix TaxID=222440 RepID=A0A5J4WU52_9EUKA|nr:MAG: hypothetical protein EZS28_005916 [Streblomastix strix]
MIKLIYLSKSSDILEIVGRMRKQKRHLTPGDVQKAHIKSKEVKSSQIKSQHKVVQLKKQPMIQLRYGAEHGEDIDQCQDNSSITGNI